MERILLDGTTLMSATRLLAGEDPPTALNVYSLSLLVECLILHTELIVLDTSPEDDRLTQAATVFGDAVWVERRSSDDILERYLGLKGVTARDLTEPAPEWPLGANETPQAVAAWTDWQHRMQSADEAVMDLLSQMMAPVDRQQELGSYLDMLDAVHREQFQYGRGEWEQETVPELSPISWPSEDGPQTSELATPRVNVTDSVKIADHTELREVAAAGSTATMLSGLAQRLNYPRDSFWYSAQLSRSTYLTEFTPALLMRTRFYLLASEVFAAPYRPDVLRAPICWKFFDRGPFADLTIDERMVDLADAAARARVESANQLIGRPAFTALPLFLSRVLASSNNRTDIAMKTMQIRKSPEARRFRKVMAGLAAAQEAENVSILVRDAAQYSDLLRREYGSTSGGAGSTDVLWSLAADATKAALDPTGTSVASLAGSVGKTAVRAPDLVRRWLYGRRMALIGRTIRTANKAKAMQGELRRLFGAELSPGDIQFLEQVGRLGFDPADR